MPAVIETGILSDAQLRLAVEELTSGDPVAVQRLSQLLSGAVGLEVLPFEGHESLRSLDLLTHSLHYAGRLVELDWAIGHEFALPEFAKLFDIDSIPWPDGIGEQLQALHPDIERGDDMGYVFAHLDPVVREAGYEILDLNHGGDSYWIFLAPSAAAERWRNVVLGEDGRIESPEWQFKSILERLGRTPLYPGHPSDSVQDPPEAP